MDRVTVLYKAWQGAKREHAKIDELFASHFNSMQL